MFQNLLLDAGFIDESSVGADEVLNEVAFRRFHELGVMTRHMLIIQHDVRITLASNQDFRVNQSKGILLSIRS